MRIVCEFNMPLAAGTYEIELPPDATILVAAERPGELVAVWIEVSAEAAIASDDRRMAKRSVLLLDSTGEVPGTARYVSTFLARSGQVFHLYEIQ